MSIQHMSKGSLFDTSSAREVGESYSRGYSEYFIITRKCGGEPVTFKEWLESQKEHAA